MVHYAHIWWDRTSMIKLVRDLRVMNILAKFQNYPWKIADVRVLTGLVCPTAARPPAHQLGWQQYPRALLKGCMVKRGHKNAFSRVNHYHDCLFFRTWNTVCTWVRTPVRSSADCLLSPVVSALNPVPHEGVGQWTGALKPEPDWCLMALHRLRPFLCFYINLWSGERFPRIHDNQLQIAVNLPLIPCTPSQN